MENIIIENLIRKIIKEQQELSKADELMDEVKELIKKRTRQMTDNEVSEFDNLLRKWTKGYF